MLASVECYLVCVWATHLPDRVVDSVLPVFRVEELLPPVVLIEEETMLLPEDTLEVEVVAVLMEEEELSPPLEAAEGLPAFTTAGWPIQDVSGPA